MKAIKNIDYIPVSVMRKALGDSGYSVSRASVELGWGKDGHRLQRALGSEPYRGRKATHVSYNVAVKMVRAWNLDPFEYGV
jgi:hypothetical protein